LGDLMAYTADINRKNVKAKAQKVSEITSEIKKYKTFALIDLTKLSDALLQSIRKKIREDGGKLLVVKKPIVERILKNQKFKNTEEYSSKPVALILTNSTPYELNKFFRQNKKKRAAKAGEKAPFEIVVPAGDTDIPPGPALSELKSAGINVQIKAGKIVVAKDSVLAKSGEEITIQKVKALQQLGIMPFETSVNLIFGYNENQLFKKDALDIDLTFDNDLRQSYRDAFNLAMNAGYPTKENIGLILREAFLQSINLSLNGKLYSSVSIEQLLASAQMQGMALRVLSPKEKTDG